ncbi:MAG TPA: uroporphyrinogen-III synthase [Cyclobacteriaceae bacterium]|nr:uroporphyrinogen-III synthase [Cyclobacteriaceae bacterium]
MNVKPHIVFTREPGVAATSMFSELGWQVTAHDFISKQISIPEHIVPDLIHKHIVITSQTGVEAFLVLLNQFQLDREAYNVFCIEQATQQAALKGGLKVQATAPNAAALADEILKHTDIHAVTHICSNRRRDELSVKLKSAGIKVQDFVAYRTEPTPVLFNEPYDAIVFFSPSAIDSFLSQNTLVDIPCFCIGKTTETHARQKGYTMTFTPDVPSEEALLKTLFDYFSNSSIHVKE